MAIILTDLPTPPTCQYKEKFYDFTFTCDEPKDTGNNLCIFHNKDYLKGDNYEKNKEEVARRFKEKLSEYVMKDMPLKFIGYCLPDISFQNKRFTEAVSFSDATFYGVANFGGAKFSGEAHFSGATFSHQAYFEGAMFSEEAFFSATFSEANFSGATFSGAAYFGGATFSGAAYFESTFSNQADFAKVTFSEEAFFTGTTFSKEAYFMEATFSGKAIFSGATFSEEAFFNNATFSNEADFKADFTGTTFSKEAYFSAARFSKVDFSNATFSTKAYFVKPIFSNEAFFTGAIFLSEAYFSGEFNGQIYFNYTTFREPTQITYEGNMSKVSFSDSDITKIRFGDKVTWGGNDGYTIIEEQWLKDKSQQISLDLILSVYRNLRENYEYRLRYDEAGKFFTKEMELKRKYRDVHSKTSNGFEFKENCWFRRNLSLTGLYYNLFVYGEDLKRPALILLLPLFILSTVYWGVIDPSPSFSNDGFALWLNATARTAYDMSQIERKDAQLIDSAIKTATLAILGMLLIPLRRKFERKYTR